MDGRELPRREREKLAQRGEMMATALDLFSKKGYRNVSMQEIAEKAEFAVGTLYKFFRNKEDLYKALLGEQADAFDEALRIAIEGPGLEIDKLRNYVKAKGLVFRSNVSVIRLYLAETQGASLDIKAGLDTEIRERYGIFLNKLASVFESGMKRKRFRKIADPFSLAVALDSITSAFLLLWLEEPERHPYPEDPDAILNILFKGLVDQ
ncbi:MAG: TetR/AcrR family transcriptional regulator [Deltaproteobacteria bacterium]|nr:TetR/AcrR family transcriptional regulator [Deltaproteobacteria bacterium]